MEWQQGGVQGKALEVEYKDVWNVKWADDNPTLVAVMKKAKLIVLTTDVTTSTNKAPDNPWWSAEAYHFLMMCQTQLYAGEWDACLTEYENIIGTKLVYCLVALSS